MTLNSFAQTVREMMAALPDLQRTANEGSAIQIAPGGFSPTCEKHETLRSTPDVFQVRINQGTQQLNMMQVFLNWFEGRSPSVVIAPNASANNCIDQ